MGGLRRFSVFLRRLSGFFEKVLKFFLPGENCKWGRGRKIRGKHMEGRGR
jgi:hypothetical protein